MMTLIVWAYVVVVIMAVRQFVFYRLDQAQAQVQAMQKRYQDLLRKQEEFNDTKKHLADRSAEIFTLYELTRAITKNFSEQDAFAVFKTKVAEKIKFEECLLVHPLSQDLIEYQFDKNCFVVPLQGRNKLLGYFVIRGMDPSDRETLEILAQQFSLALRRIRLYQDQERLSITDSLTELYTRRYILERLEEELRRSQQRKIHLTLLMVDVDYFKNINDQHGHLVGDQILREIAGIVRQNIREIDIAGRFGGEEFAVVLPDTDEQGAQYAAERIRQAVEKSHIKAYDVIVSVTVSVGAATYPEDDQDADQLIENADGALYRAKSLGRNKVCNNKK